MDEFDDVEDFLAHHGVKGQKWGVKRELSTAVASTGTALSKAKAVALKPTSKLTKKQKQEAVTAAKAAFVVSKVGVVPLVAATGVGIPVIGGLGLSMKLVSDPTVRSAVVSAGKYTDAVVKDYGGVAISTIKTASMVHTPSSGSHSKSALANLHLKAKSTAKKTTKKAVKGAVTTAASHPDAALMLS
jgi:hypothetical protein